MDGSISGGDLGVSVGDDDMDVLVDDATGDGGRVHDRGASELVAYLKGNQGALLLIDGGSLSVFQLRVESAGGRKDLSGSQHWLGYSGHIFPL